MFDFNNKPRQTSAISPSTESGVEYCNLCISGALSTYIKVRY